MPINGMLRLASWSVADGSAGAPVVAAGAQHPTWLQGANTGTVTQSPSYVRRAAWSVAGVDYPVGIPDSSFPLKDPTAGGLPAGASLSGQNLNITADSVTLDGWDFTKSNGISVNCNSHAGIIIQNCKFAYSAATTSSLKGPVNTFTDLTLLNCDIDGTNYTTSTFPGLLQAAGSGTLNFRYNWIRNSSSDLMTLSGGTQVFKYNLFENAGITPAAANLAHPDFFQWDSGTPSPTIQFNTFMQNVGSGGVFGQAAYLANVTFGDNDFSFNTMRSSPGATPTGADGSGGLQMHDWWASGTFSAGAASTVRGNYVDVTDCTGFVYNGQAGGGRTGTTFSGNINMVSGASLDTTG